MRHIAPFLTPTTWSPTPKGSGSLGSWRQPSVGEIWMVHIPLCVHQRTSTSQDSATASNVSCSLKPHPGRSDICFSFQSPTTRFATDTVGSLPFTRSMRMIASKGSDAPVSAGLHTCWGAPSSVGSVRRRKTRNQAAAQLALETVPFQRRVARHRAPRCTAGLKGHRNTLRYSSAEANCSARRVNRDGKAAQAHGAKDGDGFRTSLCSAQWAFWQSAEQ